MDVVRVIHVNLPAASRNGNPESVKQIGFPLEFIPMKIGVGMTIE